MFRSALIRAALIATAVLALVACSSHNAAGQQEDAAKTATPAASMATRQKTVFDDQLKALDKAKAVEKQLQEDKKKQDAEIEAQGG